MSTHATQKKILCVIPARIGSTRLPRKPLLKIGGIPMVQRTYEAVRHMPMLTKVVVATDSAEIADVITRIGGEVAMTDPDIPTGSARVGMVAERYPDMDVIINLQGDEPFIQPNMLEALVAPFFSDPEVRMSTLACPLDMQHEYNDPNIVKVLVDKNFDAIYFSRSGIPYFRTEQVAVPVFHHQGVYAFTKDFLKKYCQLPPTPLDQAELLEQLRVLEHGYRIRVCVTPHRILEINIEEELIKAEEFLKGRNEL